MRNRRLGGGQGCWAEEGVPGSLHGMEVCSRCKESLGQRRSHNNFRVMSLGPRWPHAGLEETRVTGQGGTCRAAPTLAFRRCLCASAIGLTPIWLASCWPMASLQGACRLWSLVLGQSSPDFTPGPVHLSWALRPSLPPSQLTPPPALLPVGLFGVSMAAAHFETPSLL